LIISDDVLDLYAEFDCQQKISEDKLKEINYFKPRSILIIRLLLNILAMKLKLNSLDLKDNECYIIFDQKFHVTIKVFPDEGSLLLYSMIGALPMKNKLKTYEKILEWNSDISIGNSYINNNNELMIEFGCSFSRLTFRAFYYLIEHFVNSIEYLMKELDKFEKELDDISENEPVLISELVNSLLKELSNGNSVKNNQKQDSEKIEAKNPVNTPSLEAPILETTKNTSSSETPILVTISNTSPSESESGELKPSDTTIQTEQVLYIYIFYFIYKNLIYFFFEGFT
jgi:hypothetical protein